ncbi:MAG: ribosome biogenesis GTPase Der [Myxococcota bacterium]
MGVPVVAIVGRPNVGKSTLFNRLVGFRKAVVHDRPGVTRDRLYEPTEMIDRSVLLIDTGGIEPEPDTDLLSSMRRQSLIAVEEADVIVFLVDGRAGLTPADTEVAGLLRRSGKQIVVGVNKIDGHRHDDLQNEFWAMGLEPLVGISAAHGRGIYELCDEVVTRLPEAEEGESATSELPVEGTPIEEADNEGPGPIRIAVVGRPNIGKSTLINALLGEDRHVVDNVAGTTMDPVDSAVEIDGKPYVLVDTAGVRKKARIDDKLERFVSLRAIRSIERCHVVLLMIDGTEGPTDQDARLAQLVTDRGRAIVVLINKWDLVKDLEDIDSRSTEDELARRLPHIPWAPHLFVSAKTGKGLHRVIATVDRVYEAFDRRVSTSVLNRFLEQAVAAHTPPQRYHHPVRLYYATQTRVRPPTFALFSNTPEGIGATYRKYLSNRLRTSFDFEGTPLRLHFKRRRKLGEPPGESSG